jgi:pimeloyl-ACP methyl ester carboxylesterase
LAATYSGGRFFQTLMHKTHKLKNLLLITLLTTTISFAQAKDESEASLPSQPIPPFQRSALSNHSGEPIRIGDGGRGGWLFLPANPVRATAPVVIFCHGWSAIRPRGYQAWIDHLVMQGNIVLWPNYQDNLRTPTRDFLPNAIVAVNEGLKILQTGRYGVQPDLSRIAVVGHSAGGMVAAGISAEAKHADLPKIAAVMSVEPGDSRRGGVASIPLADLSTVPPDTLFLILVGEEDTSVGTFDGERLLHESAAIPSSNKALLMIHSDNHGSPALIANHFAPSALLTPDGKWATTPSRQAFSRNTMNIGVVDALDWNGTWRLLDALLNAAFVRHGDNHIFQAPSLLSLGKWSDGVPIKPLTRMR